MNQHLCHAHGCNAVVPPSMFMCKPHWYALRKPLRDAIWREYQQGQETSKRPTARYMAVQRLAVGELAFKPHDGAAALVSARYCLSASEWRDRAIAQGLGDPFVGVATPAWFEALQRAEEKDT